MEPKAGLFLLAPILALTAVTHGASAQSEAPAELFTRIGHYATSYRINPDGSFVEDREWSMTVLKEQAVNDAKQASIGYSTSIEKAEVKAAYTLKPDGRRIDAPKSNFQLDVNSGKDKDAPVFSDRTTMTVVFPEVAVGDTVVFSYRLTATAPMFPGQFSEQQTFGRSRAYDDVRIKIDFPASLWAQYQVVELAQVQDAVQGDRRVLEWTYQNKQPVKSKREDYSVYDVDKEPGFAFSTFRNYAEIAEAYGKSARPKAAVNDRVRKLADEIAVDKTAPRDVARALYDWVSTNISYAGNCVGLGAVVPHDTGFILDNRMGDCKDHATLLQALLAAKDISSTQALINAGSSYQLPKIPVVSMVNHVITYIPSMDLFADSTSDSTPFGTLPMSDAGKPVLLVDGYHDDTRTPIPAPGTNEQSMRTTLQIQPDGSVKGDAHVTLKGLFAVYARAGFREMSHEYEEDLLKNYFRSQGYIGSGSLQRGDAKPLLDSYEYSAAFEVKEMLRMHGPGAFTVAPTVFSQSPISNYLAIAVQDVEPDHEVTCSNGRSIEEYVYELPKGIKILATPDDVKLSNDFLTYSATYKLKGDTLTVKRVFDDRTVGNVCSPEVIRASKDFAQKVLQDVKSQVVYK